MDKADKAQKLRAWRAKQRETSRTLLPLDDVEMKALFDMLDLSLQKQDCDHSRGLTDAWLRDRGHSLDVVHRWLDDNGGFCDCEVLANSEGAWLEATRDG